ncbi:MAG: TetR/AcrR family transcriptional regulator [Caulobacterales bacterium]
MAAAALTRREQNKFEKRGRIIAAARALFTRKGFDATTSQEIAEAAGVAAGTVFTYARTKDDLLILVFHDEMLEVVERAYEAAGRREGLLGQTIVFFETFVAYHERDVPLAHALLRQLGYVASAEQRATVSDLMTVLLRRLAQLVEAAKQRGEVAATSPLLASARALFAIYYFHLGGLLNGYMDRAQFDRTLRTDLELLLTGLA